ncbi:MAG: hypothetical protein ACO200_05035 [Steroidobacteraceae bacterium]
MTKYQTRGGLAVAAAITILMLGSVGEAADEAARGSHGAIINSQAADAVEWSAEAVAAVQATVQNPDKINGKVPAGKWGNTTTVFLSERVDENNVAYRVYLTTRPAGHRSPVHVHPYAGMDCVIGGEVLYMYEGQTDTTITLVGCIPLIPYTKMSALAVTDMKIVTYFTLPKGAPEWIVVEPDAIAGDQDRWQHATH